MTSPRTRRKDVLGQHLTSTDGNEWKWEIDGVEYHWRPDGWLHTHSEHGGQRVMYSLRVEGAVGYTAGLHDGRNQASRANGQKV